MEQKKSIEALVEKKEGKLIAVASTENRDRVGDIVKAEGWILNNFKRNPVLMFAHDYRQPPVGLAKNIRIEDRKLIFEPVFHGITQLSKEIGQMYESEPPIMRAFSVGFIPLKYNEDTREITEQELLEISAVPVPANAEALSQISKSIEQSEEVEVKGWIDKELEEKEEDGKRKPCSECEKKEEVSFEESEIISKEVIEKPYPNEHACRLQMPDKYDSFARKNCYTKHDDKCIDFIFGIKASKSELQSMRYDKSIWTAESAKSHCQSHEGSFEAASGKLEEIEENNIPTENELIETPENENQDIEVEENKIQLEKDETIEIVKRLQEEVALLKEGRVLSGKNRDLIKNALSILKQASSTLKELLGATEPMSVEDSRAKEKGRKEEEQKPLKNKKVIVRALQKIAKDVNKTLHEVK